ncbi:MAG: type I restriction-modification system subunit M N-terminal domain-containing protein, partial [Bryobacteraceae bacterium]
MANPCSVNQTSLSSFIWSVADLLRGDYKQSEYGKVILPFTVLRRLDCVLEPTKAAVLAEHAAQRKQKLNAEPLRVTDPHLVFDLRMKLDAAGFYDEFEVNRVVEVEFDPRARQGDLAAALEPVLSRLLMRYRDALARWKAATAKKETQAAEEAKQEMDALVLFKHDMTTFQRIYVF